MSEVDEDDVARREKSEQKRKNQVTAKDGVCRGKKVSQKVKYPHENADVLGFFGAQDLEDLGRVPDQQKNVPDVADDWQPLFIHLKLS
jgi:hypothetical protein